MTSQKENILEEHIANKDIHPPTNLPSPAQVGSGLAETVLAENETKLSIQRYKEFKDRLSAELKLTRRLVKATGKAVAETEARIEKLSNAKDLPDRLAIARTIVSPKNINRKGVPIHAGLANAVDLALASQLNISVEILKKHENRVAVLEEELKLATQRWAGVKNGKQSPPPLEEELGGGVFSAVGVESESEAQREYNAAIKEYAERTARLERVWQRIVRLTPDDAQHVLRCAIDQVKLSVDKNSDDVDCVVRNNSWPPGKSVVRLVRLVRHSSLTAKQIVSHFKQIELATAAFCGLRCRTRASRPSASAQSSRSSPRRA